MHNALCCMTKTFLCSGLTDLLFTHGAAHNFFFDPRVLNLNLLAQRLLIIYTEVASWLESLLLNYI